MTKYIDLSLNLTNLFKGTSLDEASLHELSKRVVSNDYSEDKVQQVYDKYLESLNEQQKKEFKELFYDQQKWDYYSKKIHRVLGFYLTKHQISRLVDDLNVKLGASRAHIIKGMVDELTKDIGLKKAVKAIEATSKDLKIFEKMNPGLVDKYEQMFTVLIKHDEL
ncbi:unnamed protein product [Caenorhabditis bovis]|uniref:Uncharacterized protein n=1 Tax=Caenorhabditis bovis TaxID=2654633 RepID=A0A8S1EP89_9PELO|nr:unnamed protein product [Caenorhabditis bovis]